MGIVAIIMRWAHILSMSFLAGGAIFGRMVVVPALNTTKTTGDRVSSHLREVVWLVIIVAVVSGAFNLFNAPDRSATYHVWFGVKMLGALHLIGVWIALARQGVSHERRQRMMMGAAISGAIVIAISTVLRTL
ncbi:MAG: hypothetical protein HYZ37_05310 [Candidatus Solibacter usitatus]|nr:hypothetical protein [Candidatus Solibacter usitatus]